MDASRLHWQRAYLDHSPDELSWFEAEPATSLELIERTELPRSAAILDVGGGASRLAAELLRGGYLDVTVADLSAAALERARAELGADAERVEWIEADVRRHEFSRRYDLWHDRAVLHFMYSADDRDAYVETLERTLRPSGYLVLATFGPEGPEQCSGLAVRRYGPADLEALLGDEFELIDSRLRTHVTPRGTEQQFHHALLRR